MKSVKQVALELAVSEQTIYRAVWSGALPAARVGSLLRIEAADVDRMLHPVGRTNTSEGVVVGRDVAGKPASRPDGSGRAG